MNTDAWTRLSDSTNVCFHQDALARKRIMGGNLTLAANATAGVFSAGANMPLMLKTGFVLLRREPARSSPL
jgi:hypothetical protein